MLIVSLAARTGGAREGRKERQRLEKEWVRLKAVLMRVGVDARRDCVDEQREQRGAD